MLTTLYNNINITDIDKEIEDLVIDDFLEADEFVSNMQILEKKWGVNFEELVNNPILADLIFYRNLKISSFDKLEDIEERIVINNKEISVMLDNLEELFKYNSIEERDYETYKSTLGRYAEISMYAGKSIISKFHSTRAFYKYHDFGMNIDKFKEFKPEEEVKQNDLIRLIDAIMDEIEKQGLKKDGCHLYQRRYVDDIDTHTFKFLSDVEQFMFKNFGNKYKDIVNWELLQKSDHKKICAKIEANNEDVRAPSLVIDRYKFSFRNGVYVLMTEENGQYKDLFIPYSNKVLLKKHKVDKKTPISYFDLEYPEELINNYDIDFYDIQTPNYSKIIDYQMDDEEVKRVFYMLMGRSLTQLGEYDGWQIMPILKGLAGTGKGTALKIFNFIYDEKYIGTMENEMEKKFGLEGLYEKLIILGPEIGRNLQLDQMQFQKMVSGEQISIPRKGKIAVSKQWDSHMLWAANELPDYNDNSGSIQRRMVITQFDKPVDKNDSDTNLEAKIKLEIPFILTKLIRAYQYYLNRYKSQNFWNFCPVYFEDQRDLLAFDRNPIYSFLTSREIEYGQNYYTEFNELSKRFLSFIKQTSGNGKMSADNIKSPLDTCCKRRGIKSRYVQNSHSSKQIIEKYENGSESNVRLYGDFIIGIRLTENYDEDEEKYSDNKVIGIDIIDV